RRNYEYLVESPASIGESCIFVGESPTKLAKLQLLETNPYTGFTECLPFVTNGYSSVEYFCDCV
ncbi:MAG: hypothetical protein IJ714_04540, partial [Bacteroidales bacterium]|nr:hypothetical protein [Bacteroidales bacterium]